MEKVEYGLSLGGGAARGFAHIGVIKFLEENLIDVLEVSGTSMGALVAGCYAIGMTSSEMQNLASSIDYWKFIDPDLSTGLIKGDKIKDKLVEIFGDRQIQDCDKKLKIVATDIGTGKRVVFESGKIVDAIRASISIPMIFKPYELDGVQFVDGGICTNLPTDLISQKNIIAVSVLRDIGRPIITKRRLLGIEIPLSFFGTNYQILQKSIDIMMDANESKSLMLPGKSITYVHPDFTDIDYYEFNRSDEIIQIGYDEMKKNFGILINL